MDFREHQRETLQHCLRIAAVDQEYAQWAADRYERDSCGVLAGLGDKVRAAIAKHTRGQQHDARQDNSSVPGPAGSRGRKRVSGA